MLTLSTVFVRSLSDSDHQAQQYGSHFQELSGHQRDVLQCHKVHQPGWLPSKDMLSYGHAHSGAYSCRTSDIGLDLTPCLYHAEGDCDLQ